MTDSEDLRDALSSRSFGAATIDPEAQAVVTDFLDYTEYLPSDLTRSYTLIRTLDETYETHVAQVHSLTTTYGKLPSLPANERPDAATLRREISTALDQALKARSAASEEAKRINQVLERHMTRLRTIKTKLNALPKPPSRDPTPPPLPSPIRSRKEAEKQRYYKSDKKKGGNRYLVPGNVLSLVNDLDDSDEEEYMIKKSPSRRRHTIDVNLLKKTPKSLKIITAPKSTREPKGRGDGTSHGHRPVAGMSTTSALALLTPPPADAPAGSMWRPWFKLTEYEMAKLRKSMKKNAVWTPSEGMVRRELNKDGRGKEFYDKAKAEAEAKGDLFLDEESVDVLKGMPDRGAISRDDDETGLKPNAGMRLSEAKRLKKEAESIAGAAAAAVDTTAINDTPSKKNDKTANSRASTRQQTKESALQFTELNRRLAAMRQGMGGLFDSTVQLSPAATTRSARKRKRPSDKEANIDPTGQDSATTSPRQVPKRTKTGDSNDTSLETPVKLSTEMDMDETPATGTVFRTTTTTVPLAPEGPSSPLTPVNLVVPGSSGSDKKYSTVGYATAAISRPRRVSAVIKTEDAQQATPSIELASHSNRRRSGRSATPHMPALGRSKAASAEPPARRHELRTRKEIRRLSVNAETALPTPTIVNARGSRAGARTGGRKPPGLVMVADKNGNGRVSLGRRKAQPSKKHAAGASKKEEEEEDEDEDEDTYCVCGGVSWGTMVACDNPDCEKEWFHISCVGLSKAPDKDAKWYCPDCKDRVPKRPTRGRK